MDNFSEEPASSTSRTVDEATVADDVSAPKAMDIDDLETMEGPSSSALAQTFSSAEEKQEFIKDTAKKITKQILTNAVWWYSSEWASILQKFRMHKDEINRKELALEKTVRSDMPTEYCWYCKKDIRLTKMPVHIELCEDNYYQQHPDEVEEINEDMF